MWEREDVYEYVWRLGVSLGLTPLQTEGRRGKIANGVKFNSRRYKIKSMIEAWQRDRTGMKRSGANVRKKADAPS